MPGDCPGGMGGFGIDWYISSATHFSIWLICEISSSIELWCSALKYFTLFWISKLDMNMNLSLDSDFQNHFLACVAAGRVTNSPVKKDKWACSQATSVLGRRFYWVVVAVHYATITGNQLNSDRTLVIRIRCQLSKLACTWNPNTVFWRSSLTIPYSTVLASLYWYDVKAFRLRHL